jgi:trehalose 6-phosphate phosphatase
MKHLYEAWDEVEPRIRNARLLFLLLDYDGTLCPIVPRPDLAVCPPQVKVLLERLRDSSKVRVAIISGRALEDLKDKVRVQGIIYVGNHGLEVENPAGTHRKKLSPERQDELRKIRDSLETNLKLIPGILFEDKGPILTVHYRNTPREFTPRVQKAVEEVLQPFPDRWQSFPGKKIVEIRPKVGIDKGKTVKEILIHFPSVNPLPVYLGDDRSDEDAFRVIGSQGISVWVGPGAASSSAQYFLRDPEEVRGFLQRCQEILED